MTLHHNFYSIIDSINIDHWIAFLPVGLYKSWSKSNVKLCGDYPYLTPYKIYYLKKYLSLCIKIFRSELLSQSTNFVHFTPIFHAFIASVTLHLDQPSYVVTCNAHHSIRNDTTYRLLTVSVSSYYILHEHIVTETR